MSTQLIEDLKKFYGHPPYDKPGNIVRGDGYFALSLEKKYGKKIEVLSRETGIGHRR